MRIQFCGANRTVTGSCHLIEVNGLRLFLDFGMYQGPRDETRLANQYLPDDAAGVDAVILSHGHLDHCGKLPVLTRNDYRGPVYCTPATAEVARIVLEDAAEIQEEDASYLNRRSRRPGDEPVQPLYTRQDAREVLKLFQTIKYNQKVDLGNQVFFTFHDAGHIIGSAYVSIEWTNGDGKTRRTLFTGDIGRYDSAILRDPEPLIEPFDHIITESTYGGRTHAPMDEVAPQFLDAVRHCIEHRTRLLVPSFAVGRTQVVLWYIQKFIHEKRIPPIPIFIDSPMGVEVTHVHRDFPESYDEETRAIVGNGDLFGISRVTLARSAQQSRDINSQRGPCVIIASSPTCEFGRILHHLKISLERENDMVVFVGWTPPHTLGRRIQDGAQRLRIYDRYYDLRCQVRTIHGLSAHADSDELVRFLTPGLSPHTSVYIVHGDADQSESLARRLADVGTPRVVVPAMETTALML